MWADHEAAIDLLNVGHLVSAVLRAITDDRLDPVTIGVYGDWGSGKSTVIRRVREVADADPELLCVSFNGWRFEGYEDAKSALASTILEEIRREAKKEKGKLQRVKAAVAKAARSFGSRIDKLGFRRQIAGMGLNAGIAAGGVALGATIVGAPVAAGALGIAALGSLLRDGKELDGKKLADLLIKEQQAAAAEQRRLHVSIRDFHRRFARLVAALEVKRLVIIVDDLDRCLPTSVVDTLEAIRLFLAAPRTAFVIAADEALIRDAVAQRFPERRSSDALDETPRSNTLIGARYLEKLIQVPVRVPPLSRSDLHGYLNLLFAEQREEPGSFAKLCDRVRASARYDAISFHAGNAEELLQHPIDDRLKEDLVLAEQIAPVLALCAEGNPRQTKRFLNALVLRLAMAEERVVKLDRATAAKLLLLEYFLPELFRELALVAAANEGRSSELAALEMELQQSADSDAAESAAATISRFGAMASAMRVTDRFQAWLRTEPSLGAIDLRPYVYFATERFALPAGLAQRLSPGGAAILHDLLSDSEAAQKAAAERLEGISPTEVRLITSELTAKARSGRIDLGLRTSPMHAMVKVAHVRLDAAPDVIAALVGMPNESLPAAAALLISSLGQRHPSLSGAATAALQALAVQGRNPALQVAAKKRLEKLAADSSSSA